MAKRGKPVTVKILRYVQEHGPLVYKASELAKAIGAPAKQTANAVHHMVTWGNLVRYCRPNGERVLEITYAGMEFLKPQETREANCLNCRRQFMSEGPHNRVCKACKELPSWQNHSSLDDQHHGLASWGL